MGVEIILDFLGRGNLVLAYNALGNFMCFLGALIHQLVTENKVLNHTTSFEFISRARCFFSKNNCMKIRIRHSR